MDTNILISWGAKIRKYKKGEFVFNENAIANKYYQIETGMVKICNINSEGKEFTQGIFVKGESFGEPPLFINEPYPASAIAATDSVIFTLEKNKFFCILNQYRSIEKDFLKILAERIYRKATSVRDLINNNPKERIIAFLSDYKKKNNITDPLIPVPFTRQTIANFIGLRVETVIRTLRKMDEEKIVKIIDRKLYFYTE